MPKTPMLAMPLLLLAPPLAAQAPATTEHLIQVTGSGVVETMPDIATVTLSLRGEGATADAATQALADRQKAVAGGIAALLGRDAVPTTGSVTVVQAHSGQCPDHRGYDSRPQLSTGDCAVTGYIATLQAQVRTTNIAKAATAAGLAARLGANDARLDGYALSDPEAARTRASAAALKAARQRAEAIAQGAGVTLGPIATLRDESGGDIVVSGMRLRSAPPPMAAPAPMAPPVDIDAKPRPIETRAQVSVTYTIRP